MYQREDRMATERKRIIVAGRTAYAAVKDRLEATRWGSVVVIDVNSGDFEVDDNPAYARKRILTRRPSAKLYETRIGQPEEYRLLGVRKDPNRDD